MWFMLKVTEHNMFLRVLKKTLNMIHKNKGGFNLRIKSKTHIVVSAHKSGKYSCGQH